MTTLRKKAPATGVSVGVALAGFIGAAARPPYGCTSPVVAELRART